MAGFIKVEVEKFPVQPLNMQINEEVFHNFKVKCKQRGLPLNIVIEIFMNQYANGRYHLDKENIMKWKECNGETDTLNSTFNKEVYTKFKDAVKKDKLFVKHVITAFIEDYVKNDLIMEFVNNDTNKVE